jgi:hypothetical protein
MGEEMVGQVGESGKRRRACEERRRYRGATRKARCPSRRSNGFWAVKRYKGRWSRSFASTSPPGAAGEGHSLDPVLRRRKGALRTDRRGACRSGRNLAGFGRAAATELKGDGGLIRPSAYPPGPGQNSLFVLHTRRWCLAYSACSCERKSGRARESCTRCVPVKEEPGPP